MNQKTGIQTAFVDAVAITDAAFFEAPIIFMEPIPRALIKLNPPPFQYSRIRRVRGTQTYSQREIQRLRAYLIHRGGFIYMAAHGNTPQTLLSAHRVLRQILPEHQLTPIPNDHEIYRAYYSLNGPLRFPIKEVSGMTIHFGSHTELQGVFINGRLAVLVDTEAMMHVIDGAVQKPFHGSYEKWNTRFEEYAPHAARQLINIVVYAITHGNISDYSKYIPSTALKDADREGFWRKAPRAMPKL
ncbi:MAG: DUF4159 domain-containing protein [Candidatus Poribacteria bacterium]|nr:DUF4159 domain-containing protein [Candidatus Poribacteria bacterium]